MSDIPKGAKVPQDHQKSAAQAEAEGSPTVTVEWRGHAFVVSSDLDDWDVTTTLAFEEGKATMGIRGVLGAAQWAEFLKTQPKTRDMGDLFNAIAAACGMTSAGE